VEFCRGKDERPEMARTVRGLLPGARISGYISLGVSICSRPIGEVHDFRLFMIYVHYFLD
jgi:hypothetical protein